VRRRTRLKAHVRQQVMEIDQILSEALLVWTGWGHNPWPDNNEQRLIQRYGPVVARDLLQRLREIKNDFYKSDAWKVAPDLREVGEMAAAEFRPRHPELSEEAVRALAFCYTYDYN
jgi:hypothetical protein